MHATTWSKTEAGRQEMQQRTRRLSAGLRSILLMVDGQRSEEELQSLVAGLHAPRDALAQLAEAGLIAKAGAGAVGTPAAVATPGAAQGGHRLSPSERYHLLYTLLTEDIRTYLGLRGYFMQLKVERCSDADELSALLPEMATALSKARDHAFATRWLDGVRAALT